MNSKNPIKSRISSVSVPDVRPHTLQKPPEYGENGGCYRYSTKNEKRVVVDAVSCELVSPALFPVIRENTGKIFNFYLILENQPKLMMQLQWLTNEFPKKGNREFICLNREIFLWNREISDLIRETRFLESKPAKYHVVFLFS